ncbi:MAG: 3-deoxy-7-phosphoheptulonate synthase, partial [Ruminiclostridium sp.]|nr:3-deoxy-7-phosphoheptulonate synthase [Ruminiclostridium sp.]
LHELYNEERFVNPSVVVDCNHSNSNKRYLEQIRIAKEVLYSKRHNNDLNSFIKGLMIESYIEDGTQKAEEGIYGKSITDPCLGWEKTEKLILDIADAL